MLATEQKMVPIDTAYPLGFCLLAQTTAPATNVTGESAIIIAAVVLILKTVIDLMTAVKGMIGKRENSLCGRPGHEDSCIKHTADIAELKTRLYRVEEQYGNGKGNQ